MFFYEEVIMGTITAPTPVKTWDLGGYSEYNLAIRAQGPAAATFSVVFSYNAFSVLAENFVLPISGLGVFLKTYRMYGPNVGLLVSTSIPINFRFRIYAACCGENPGILFRWPLSFKTTQGKSLKELPDISDFKDFLEATRERNT